MSRSLLASLASLLLLPLACTDSAPYTSTLPCSDGVDNDSDGDTDFPDDLGCTGDDDDSEDSAGSPQCKDGRDNDGDGKRDFPNDPGCFAPQQDDESDRCPEACPQCADGIDNDMNGQTDFPADSAGCTAASDTDEYTEDPAACGGNVAIKKLSFDGHGGGMLMAGGQSMLMSPMCGGPGAEAVYEIRVQSPKVVVASTNNDVSSADTVLYLRGTDCQDTASEVACNDNVSTADKQSFLAVPVSTPGTYYLVVDSFSLGGMYELTVQLKTGEGESCADASECGPNHVCRIPKGGTSNVCSRHVCDDTIDEDGDGKAGYPADPGCTSSTDDDESDPCPGAGCPQCGDGIDNDADALTDFGSDPTCVSASSVSEACIVSDGLETITAASTTGTTVGAVNDGKPACATTFTHTAPDKMYRIRLPALDRLTIDNVNTFGAATALYDATCGGTALACDSFSTPERLSLTNLPGGIYYYMVDGYSTASGAFTINISGKIKNGASCDSALATAGALTCNTGYSCQGTAGSKRCQAI